MTGNERIGHRWLVAHGILLATAAVVLVLANRGQWFFGDEWEFLVNRGLAGARLGLFHPHNEHWSTLPILVFVTLRDTVGLASYWPYIGVLILVHLALTHLLWRVMLRARVSAPVATITAGLFGVLGVGSENLLWAFQIGFIGAVALGWTAALVVATDGRRLGPRDGWAVLLLLGALMCSGVGVPMVVVAATAVWISSRSVWRPLVVGGVPAVVFLVWYENGGRVSTQAGKPAHSLGALLSIVGSGLRHAVSATFWLPALVATVLLVAGGIACVWAGVRAVRQRRDADRAALPLAGLAGVLAFCVMVALGRGDLGSSRYVYVIVALGLPALALAVATASRWRWVEAAVVVAVVVVAVHNVQLLRTQASADRARESWGRDVIESAARLITQGAPTVGVQPEPVYNPDISVASLRTFVARNRLPTNATSPRGELGARLFIQVAVVSPGAGPASTPATIGASSGLAPAAGTGCLVPAAGATTSDVVVRIDGGVHALWLRSEGPDGAQYGIELGSGPSAPPERVVVVPAGQEKELVFDLPAGVPDLTVRPVTPGSSVCTTR